MSRQRQRVGLVVLALIAVVITGGITSVLAECPCNDPGCDPECGVAGGDPGTATGQPDNQDLRLSVQCQAPPGAGEANIGLQNVGTALDYKVRIRTQVVCPPDPGEPDICMCPDGYSNWYEEGLHLCNEHECNECKAPIVPDGTRYPKQFNSGGQCYQEGDWFWCERVVLAGQPVGGLPSVGPLNSCCDCDLVRKSIVCANVEVLAQRPAGGGEEDWESTTHPDLDAECRDDVQILIEGLEFTPHPVDNVQFTCFQPLSSYCPEPSAVIQSGPDDPTCDSDVTFTFVASTPGTPAFECEIDDGGFQSYTSPFQTTVIGNGTHRFEVRDVQDPSTVNPTHDIYTWTLNAQGCGGGGPHNPPPDKPGLPGGN